MFRGTLYNMGCLNSCSHSIYLQHTLCVKYVKYYIANRKTRNFDFGKEIHLVKIQYNLSTVNIYKYFENYFFKVSQHDKSV